MSMKQPKKTDVYISTAQAEGRVDRKLRMLEAVARILSDNYNVNVVFSPEGECKTTPELMTLPYDKNVDEALILGLCGHETGHLKHTDFGVGKIIARYKKVHNRALLYVIANCLEDVRIESKMEEVYPGFIDMFQRLVPYIKEKKAPMIEREEKIKELMQQGKSDKKIAKLVQEDCRKEVERLSKGLRDAGFSEEYIKFETDQLKGSQGSPLAEISKIMDILYLQLRNYDSSWYPVEAIHYVEDYLLTIAKKVFDCKDTHEVLEVALEIYKILVEDPEDKKDRPDPDEDEEEEEEEDQEEGEEGDSSGSSPGDSSSKEGSEDKEDEEGKKEGDEESGGKSKGEEGEGEGNPGGGKPKDCEGCEEGCEGCEGEDGSSGKKPGEGSTGPGGGSGEGTGHLDETELGLSRTRKLGVGSPVTHFNHPSRRGIVVKIDSKTQEVDVQWD